MPQTTISFVTLGCPKNQVDSEFIASALDSPDYKVTHGEDFADIVLINTCGFIHDAREQSVDTILEYAEARKKGKIKHLIVFGCLVEKYRQQLEPEINEVDFWFGVNDAQKIIEHMRFSGEIPKVRKSKLLSTPGHYAYLKISEGCDRQCSFCAIPGIRGKHLSRPMEDIVQEAAELVRNGVKELIVIAQDTTYYGLDIYGKRKLPELMDILATQSGAKRIRLHYTYPAGFPQELIDVMARHKNICNYIDIPFQHVDDNILIKMKRHHSSEDIEKLIRLFREKLPDVHIRTSFICGFPGEGRSEYNKLRAFLKKHKLERIGFFAYSHEEDTEAGKMIDDVPHKTKLRRVQNLFAIQEKISLDLNLNKIGNTIEIIVDEVYDNYLLGRTEFDSPEIDNMVTVHLKKHHAFNPGDIITVRVIGADAWDLIAEPE
jgi:ribosomal protein S12 methylthiotransferase